MAKPLLQWAELDGRRRAEIPVGERSLVVKGLPPIPRVSTQTYAA